VGVGGGITVKILALIFRILLSAVFAYAGIVKVIDPASFHEAVLSYRIIGGEAAVLVTYWLPVLEIVLAVGLWIRRYASISAAISLLLLVLFSVAIVMAWIRGIDLDCGCFGALSADSPSHLYLLLRDGLLVAISAFVLWDRLQNDKKNNE